MNSCKYKILLLYGCCSEKFDQLKKQKRLNEAEKIKEIQQLQQRNNQLQTDFENAKVATAQAQRKAGEA
jgi:hypothetical protein